MDIEKIKQDKDLMKELNKIHQTLTSLMKDDVTNDKYHYEEREVSIMVSHMALNEHIAFNRLKKINALKKLSENWDNFKVLYKDDNILNKIGEEFIKGKFEFNEKILKDIKEYPFKKQVLHYFTKGVEVEMPEVKSDDYLKIKEQILPYVEMSAEKHMERKNALLKSLDIITADKSQENLEKMWTLHEEGPLGKVDGELGSFMGYVRHHVRAGDFTYEQHNSKITIQVPIAGTIENNGVKERVNSTLFSVDLNEPKNYSMQVGTLEKPKMSIEDSLNNSVILFLIKK
jgi:hypothetical protein